MCATTFIIVGNVNACVCACAYACACELVCVLTHIVMCVCMHANMLPERHKRNNITYRSSVQCASEWVRVRSCVSSGVNLHFAMTATTLCDRVVSVVPAIQCRSHTLARDGRRCLCVGLVWVYFRPTSVFAASTKQPNVWVFMLAVYHAEHAHTMGNFGWWGGARAVF